MVYHTAGYKGTFDPNWAPTPLPFPWEPPPYHTVSLPKGLCIIQLWVVKKNTFEVRFVDEVQNYRGERVPARATQPAFNANTSVEALLVLLLPPNSRTISGS